MRRLLLATLPMALAALGLAQAATLPASAGLTAHQRPVASGAIAVSASSFSVTVPSGTSTVSGRHVVVAYMFSGGGTDTLRSVTDTKGNAYTINAIKSNAGTSGLVVAIASARLTKPLVAGDRITAAQSASTTYHSLSAFEFDNFVPIGWADRAASGNAATASTSVGTGATTTTSQPNETLIAVVAFGDSAATLSNASPWGENSKLVASGTKTKSLVVAAQDVTATAGYKYAGVLSASEQSVSALVSFRTTSATSSTPSTSPSPTPSPTPTTAPQPVGVSGTWSLKFSDEFNGSRLDTSKWRPNWLGGSDSTVTKPVNTAEVSCYDPKQVGMGNSVLTLAAEARPCLASNGTTYNYASGMIQSYGHYQFTYGYLEARMWLQSDAAGTPLDWPAFWSNGTGTWPTTGEIDVMEVLGTHLCYHFHYSGGAPGSCPTVATPGGWHTFGANWQPGSITFYYDGRQVGQITAGVTSAPMYLIAQLAISGSRVSVPAKTQVDYIRVWQ